LKKYNVLIHVFTTTHHFRAEIWQGLIRKLFDIENIFIFTLHNHCMRNWSFIKTVSKTTKMYFIISFHILFCGILQSDSSQNENCPYLVEKHQIPISPDLVWPDWGSNPWSTALEASMLTITPLMCLIQDWVRNYHENLNTNLHMFQWTSTITIQLSMLI
jgi:hypothetical protein